MSEAHRYQAAWRAVTFNRVYDDSGAVDDPAHLVTAYQESDIRLTSLDLTRVETLDYREQRQFLEGAEGNEAYEGVLVAVGSGIIYATSPGDLADKTALMRSQFSVASCRIAAASLDPVGVLPFTFKRDMVASPFYLPLLIYARPASGRPVIIGRQREGLSRRFQFHLVAFDGKMYAQTAQAVSCSTSSTTTLTNNGDLPTSPSIVVVTTGGSSTIKITLGGSSANSVTFAAVPAGTWTFDTKRSTMTKADGTNGMQYRTIGYLSSLFLNAGSNTFDMAGSSGISSVTATFRDAYA